MDEGMGVSWKDILSFTALFFLLTLGLRANSIPASNRMLYHWPYLKFQEYTSASFKHYPEGDIDAKRAFYWGRVLGCDGVVFSIRGLLPHLVEGNWQEPVYTNEREKKWLFATIRRANELYTRYGCGDNFLHFHAHGVLTAQQTVTEWRTAVLEGMRQKAELIRATGIRRILIDTEFTQWNTVSNDPQFWYELGRKVITVMRAVYPDLHFGFYPGLYGYWIKLEPKEAPEKLTNLRHALLKGIFDHKGDASIWSYEGWLYGPSHLCIGEKGASYTWNLADHADAIIRAHTTLLGPGIEYVFAKWDLGKTQPKPVFKHWKQPKLPLFIMRRNYEVLFEKTNAVAIWDDYGAWDEDGAFYLTFPNEDAFMTWKEKLKDITLRSGYCYDTITKREFIIEQKSPNIEEKLKFFNIYRNDSGVIHVQGKLPDNFADYVNLTKELTGKDKQTIPLASADEFAWAKEYQEKGFFPNQILVRAGDEEPVYGYLKPNEKKVKKQNKR